MSSEIRLNSTCQYPLKKVNLHVPELKEVCSTLQEGLGECFEQVEVSVVECPDLQFEPFHLAHSGLCGNEKIADVGGPPYLIPTPQRDKHFSFRDISLLIGLKDNAFLLGAAAGPFHRIGINAELMPNISFSLNESNQLSVTNKTHFAKVYLFSYSTL